MRAACASAHVGGWVGAGWGGGGGGGGVGWGAPSEVFLVTSVKGGTLTHVSLSFAPRSALMHCRWDPARGSCRCCRACMPVAPMSSCWGPPLMWKIRGMRRRRQIDLCGWTASVTTRCVGWGGLLAVQCMPHSTCSNLFQPPLLLGAHPHSRQIIFCWFKIQDGLRRSGGQI
jgi:hypothetical protein